MLFDVFLFSAMMCCAVLLSVFGVSFPRNSSAKGFDDEVVRHFCNGDGFRPTHQLPPVHGVHRGSCGCWWRRKASPHSPEASRTCLRAGVQIPMEFAYLLPAAVSRCVRGGGKRGFFIPPPFCAFFPPICVRFDCSTNSS